MTIARAVSNMPAAILTRSSGVICSYRFLIMASILGEVSLIRRFPSERRRRFSGLPAPFAYRKLTASERLVYFHPLLFPGTSVLLELPGTSQNLGYLGPLGFEPRTKGFTLPRCFHQEWTISSPVHVAMRVGAGCSCLLLRALQPPGSLCTFHQCTGGSAQDCHEACASKVSLNSSRPLRTFPHEGTFIDESPALTTVLQARHR